MLTTIVFSEWQELDIQSQFVPETWRSISTDSPQKVSTQNVVSITE